MAICSTVEVPDVTDLNAMSEAWSPLVLTTANEIDDLGRTTGQAIDTASGQSVAFVATPLRRSEQRAHARLISRASQPE